MKDEGGGGMVRFGVNIENTYEEEKVQNEGTIVFWDSV